MSEFPFKEKNPYTPGVDRTPPIFVGRDREMDVLNRLARDLVDDDLSGRDVVFYGPRGNGKTALLYYCQPRLEKEYKIRTVLAASDEIPNALSLYTKLLGAAVPSERTVVRHGGGGVGVPGVMNVEGGQQTSRVYPADQSDFKTQSIKAMLRKPTLLMVDEAQAIKEESLLAILSLARAANHHETKFRFILAGPPGLPSHIDQAGHTNLGRLEQVRINCLDFESAGTALFLPLEKAEFKIELSTSQRDSLIEQSQCYPHFIQCIGHALWDVAKETGARGVDAELVEQAKPEWERQIKDMYVGRHREIKNRGLSTYAYAIAEWFQEQDDIHETEIMDCIHQCNKDADGIQVRGALEDLGYIWHTPDDSLTYVPGIPSLMDHVYALGQSREALVRARDSNELEL